MNIAFLCTRSYFSTAVFRHLTPTLPIDLIVLPYVSPRAPVTVPPQLQLASNKKCTHELETLAQLASIKVLYQAEHSQQQVAQYLSDHDIDIIIVACYPSLIPDIQIQASKQGAINIHPSLLPRYRGPSPIFWQLRHNEQATGVSLHCVNSRFDAGNIIAQQSLVFPLSASADEIDELVAHTAATILLELCHTQNTLHNFMSTATTQHEHQAHYHSAPCNKDFSLSHDWSAQHAYRFMRGTQQWQKPYPIMIKNVELQLTQAISYSGKRNAKTIIYEGENTVYLNFKSGSLRAQYIKNSSTT